jgi:hypothetical protein
MRLHNAIAVALALVGVLAPIAVPMTWAGTDGAAPGEVEWQVLRDTGTSEQIRRFIWEAPYGSPQRREAIKRLNAMEPSSTTMWPPAPIQGVWVPSNPPPPEGLVDPPASWAWDLLKRPPSDVPANPPSESWDRNAPQPAQKVILFEEGAANPNGSQFPGIAVWRIEPAPSEAGPESSVAIRVDVDIPERRMAIRLTLQPNADTTLPASHTVEIIFRLPPDFAHGGIASVPGIMMKQEETSRGHGDALSGVAVKVTDNVFMVGLSSVKADVSRNARLLKEGSWLDIPTVYADGKRALIAIDKGEAGTRAFAVAFAAWERTSR